MFIFRANKRGQEGLKRCIRHISDPLVSEARLKHCVGFPDPVKEVIMARAYKERKHYYLLRRFLNCAKN